MCCNVVSFRLNFENKIRSFEKNLKQEDNIYYWTFFSIKLNWKEKWFRDETGVSAHITKDIYNNLFILLLVVYFSVSDTVRLN